MKFSSYVLAPVFRYAFFARKSSGYGWMCIGNNHLAMKNKLKHIPRSIPMGIGVGLLGSVIVTLLGCAILATLIDGCSVGETAVGYGITVILLLSSIAGSCVATILATHKRLLVCAASATTYFGSLLGCNALFIGGQYHGVWVTLLLISAGATSVCLLGRRGGKKHISGRRKIKNR